VHCITAKEHVDNSVKSYIYSIIPLLQAKNLDANSVIKGTYESSIPSK
jgi:hypothetical protein